MRAIRVPVLAATLVLALASGAAAQQAAAPVQALRAGFDEVAGWVIASAERVPAERYGYRPTEGVRTFAEMLGHIADGNAYYCPRASGTAVPWSDAVAEAGLGKAQLIARLEASFDACRAAHIEGAGLNPLMANFGHVNLHYGNLVTYLRMLGLTPPSS